MLQHHRLLRREKTELRFGSGIATGIATTEADDGELTRYNLSGRRVGTGYRGIVVEKGRKRLMK